MPIPLAIGAIGAKLGTALGFAKGLAGASAAGKGIGLVGGAAGKATALTPQLVGIGKGAAARRMAGDKIASLISKMPKGATEGLNMADDAGILDRIKRGATSFAGFNKNLGLPRNADDIKMMLAPDLLFGGMAALTTEGDLMDKAIAGVGSAAGGIAGGVGARGLLGPKSGLGILGTEMVGGMIGDQIGYGVADSLIKAKHGGMTPMEKKQREADALYKQQIMQELGLM